MSETKTYGVVVFVVVIVVVAALVADAHVLTDKFVN